MKPKSPITGKRCTCLIEAKQTNDIKKDWKEKFGKDISEEFEGVSEIRKYECEETKVRFFKPKESEGSRKIYSILEEKEWYYMTDKWEYKLSEKIMNSKAEILVVGCGEGKFVEKLNTKERKAKGIDLNEKAVEKAKKEGRNVTNKKLSKISEKGEKYDYVCCFQVLEHVSRPKRFLKDCISCLREGGRLLIGVPNMEGFIGDQKNDLLNQPPHHMTQWFPETFEAVPKYLPISLETIHFEPLARYHRARYSSVQVNRIQEFLPLPSIVSRGLRFLLAQMLRIPQLRRQLRGHSQLVVFKK